MTLPKEITTVTKLSKTLAFILFISLPIVGFLLGIRYQQALDVNSKDSLNTTNAPITNHMPVLSLTPVALPGNKTKCGYFTSDLSSFLLSYTVKAGDTLLSITKSQLGTTARINEIIELNKDRYNLSLDNPFLEPGWILYLPPDYIKSSTGKLTEINGELKQINPTTGEWAVGGPNVTYYNLKTNKNTKLEKQFTIGSCVKVVSDSETGKIFKVSSQ